MDKMEFINYIKNISVDGGIALSEKLAEELEHVNYQIDIAEALSGGMVSWAHDRFIGNGFDFQSDDLMESSEENQEKIESIARERIAEIYAHQWYERRDEILQEFHILDYFLDDKNRKKMFMELAEILMGLFNLSTEECENFMYSPEDLCLVIRKQIGDVDVEILSGIGHFNVTIKKKGGEIHEARGNSRKIVMALSQYTK